MESRPRFPAVVSKRKWHFTADMELTTKTIPTSCEKEVTVKSMGSLPFLCHGFSERELEQAKDRFCPTCYSLGAEAFKQLKHDQLGTDPKH